MPRCRQSLLAPACALAAASPALAQRDFSKVEITTTPLVEGLHMKHGAGDAKVTRSAR